MAESTQQIGNDKLSGMAIMAWVFAWLALSLDVFDWSMLSFSAPLIIKEFKFKPEEMGMILGAPLIGAGIGGILSGWIADKIGRVKAMSLCLVWFSVFTVLFPFAPDYATMFILRILSGLGLGAQWGVGTTLASEYVPTRKRILASSTIQSGAALGPIAAAYVSALIIPSYGWRPTFYFGAVGFIFAIFALIFIKDPETWLHAKEKAKTGIIKLAEVRRLLEPKYLRRAIACFFLIVLVQWGYWGSLSWIPTWLATTKNMGIVKSMNYMITLNCGCAVGFLTFGLIADRWGRKPPAYVVLIASVFAAILFVSINDPGALLLFAPVYGFITLPIFGLFGGYMSELFPTEIRATAVSGVANFARFSSFLSPFVLAWVSTRATMTIAIGGTAALYLLAIVPLLFLPETKSIKTLESA
jgi:MFS family permease